MSSWLEECSGRVPNTWCPRISTRVALPFCPGGRMSWQPEGAQKSSISCGGGGAGSCGARGAWTGAVPADAGTALTVAATTARATPEAAAPRRCLREGSMCCCHHLGVRAMVSGILRSSNRIPKEFHVFLEEMLHEVPGPPLRQVWGVPGRTQHTHPDCRPGNRTRT